MRTMLIGVLLYREQPPSTPRAPRNTSSVAWWSRW